MLIMSPKKKARLFLQKYWGGTLPVDPIRIARGAGVEVRHWTKPNPLSGLFEYRDETPVIVYNKSDPEVRQRFTIAHELGHFALEHGKAFRDPARNFSLSNYDPEEVSANQFAAELLMPAEAVDALIAEQGITDFSKLARKFHVSEVAMEYRLKNLGWL